ncbi:MAG: AMP-binding protein [Spirochaetes bacterium]|nr:AMP-binding protein [Spirochaetota bacterium]
MYDPTLFTIRDILLQSSAEFAELPVLAWAEGRSYTYAELKAKAAAAAVLLKTLGLQAGDRAAILSENRPEWGMAYFGTAAAGFIVVPIMVDFGAAQIANILEHSGTKAVFVSKKLEPKLVEAFASMKAPARPAVIALEDLSEAAAPSLADEVLFPALSEDSLAAIIYTSGTTGFSKGVMLTHRNIAWNAWANRTIIVMNTRDVFLSILPLAHTYECTLGLILPVLQGSRVYYLDRPPSASALLPALAQIRPTVVLSVPLVIEKIYRSSVLPKLQAMKLYASPLFKGILERLAGLKLKKVFGGRLRFFGVGGAPLAPDVEAFLARVKFPYAIGYGLTETSPMVAGAPPFKTVPRSTGPAMRGVEIRIADARADNGEGEIQVRGPNVMRGYWRDEEHTKEVFTEDGWFRTGDLGVFDDKGRLFIRGRLKSMILGASGENIYPEEIEAILNQHELVLESIVYKDEAGLVALVQLKPEIMDAFGDAVHDGIVGMEQKAGDMLERVRKEANAKLAAFSRITKVVLQKEPFEKTPKQSIKRFRYGTKQP